MVKKWRAKKRFYLFGVVILVSVLFYATGTLDPVDSSGKSSDILVQISPNTSTGQISDMLKQQGLIQNAGVFKLYTRYHKLDNQIKAGYYLLNPSMSVDEILHLLVRGKTASKSFTIPEGYTLARITDSLANKGYIQEQLFKDLLTSGKFNYPFMKDLPSGENRLEGYLFPETYNVSLDSAEKDIINVMLAGMDRQIKELKLEEKARKMNLTLHQAITIASMIEREAKVQKDRALISSVIHNRLKIGMRLQIDATVEYALGGHREKIYYKDLEVNSPYNTYKNPGLPPGPIASPGKESLLAAVTPAKTKYLYYVAKPDGSHAFAETLEEHNIYKQRYLK
ncbi:aminodeoxychorismate lyase [Desulforamulus reducens MI-1]|uniref:Endolytic murein transglycosylase n=1 Tax=Desulforamulus reducens (strain ATCC BAA-1160 / DSM 100696 / MI-1) TaxID=349161 RepID=A4J2Y3_DESRM|nr:endolytic transglycosylase MltG [Desulforamulus reducens]ABO49436.1 aminodeoxychorismate lyase [Desulforamulus reducens MI-1]